MGLLSDAFGAVTNTIDAGTGGWWSDQSTKKSTKRLYNYNLNLQRENQDFQKYMAENAHQMEVQDLINAGLNPALSATGSSSGSIAGSSSAQGTSSGSAVGNLGDIVDSINGLRKTNADITNTTKTADANMKNAEANMKSAEAALINAQNNTALTEGGWGTKVLGTKSNLGDALPEVIGTIAGLGFGGGAIKGAWKLGNSASKIANVFRKVKKAPRKLRIKK